MRGVLGRILRVPRLKDLRKVGEGREAEMFQWRPGVVLRLLRDPGRRAQVQWEEAAMEAARGRGVRVPAYYGTVAVEGRPGLLMEAIPGPDLLTLLSRRPWRVPEAARICGEVHSRVHAVEGPAVLPVLKSVLRQRIGSAAALPPDLANFAVETLDGLPEGNALCHGDFHPGNVLMAGKAPVIIDWTNAARGDPSADVARTLLLLKLGAMPPGQPRLLRLAAQAAREVFAQLYLGSYGRSRPIDMASVESWMVPVAAARLAEGIAEEAPRVLSLLAGARRRLKV